MLLISKLGTAAIVTVAVLLFGMAGSCHAQATFPSHDVYLLGTGGPNPNVGFVSVKSDQPPAAEPANSSPPQAGLAAEDSGWHFAVSPYLWLPGVHGTIGALGRDVSVHVSPGDLLSHFRFGVMGVIRQRNSKAMNSSSLPRSVFCYSTRKSSRSQL
jgi:hypothetical protein